MKINNEGRIVNVSSGGGSLASQNGNTPAYSISKLALNGLTLQVAHELKGTNIVINSLCPGWVRTDMGGHHANRSVEQAAEDIYWLAQQHHLNGQFIRDKREIAW